MIVYDTYDEALAAKTDGDSLCGAYKGDTPVYFLVPSTASEDAAMKVAFEVRHGRPMSTYEEFLLSAARELHDKESIRP